MKSKIQSIMLACVALTSTFFVSCSDDALMEEASCNYGDQPFELKVTQSGPNSRLELGSDGLSTMWESGDKLVLVDKARKLAPIYLYCTLEENEKATSATFMSESGVPAGQYWVIYNYNENLAYGHKGFQSVDQINSNDDLVLWNELNITENSYSATVQLKHLYAKVKVVLENADNLCQNVQIGMYSSKQGFPVFKQFTSNGLVDAEYGRNLNSMYGSNDYTYLPSERKFHNIRFGGYFGEWSGDAENMSFGYSKSEGLSALILPADLSNEDMFFYVLLDDNTNICYEIKKEGIEIKAGTSYKVVLDLSQAIKSELFPTYDNVTNQNVYPLKNAADWRHAAYKNNVIGNWDGGFYSNSLAYQLAEDIDFDDEAFFPIATHRLNGNGKTLSNINLDWSNEDNVGLVRFEWGSRDENRELRNLNVHDYATQVSDLALENVTFKGKNYVGTLGGINIRVSNCKVIGTSLVEGHNYVGGLVGLNNIAHQYSLGNGDMSAEYLTLADVSVGQSCTIKGDNYVGGIVGGCMVSSDYSSSDIWRSSSDIFMESCKSQATVTAIEDYAGGIFGKLGGNYWGNSTSTSINFSMEDYTFSLIKCINEGNVAGRHYVGGIGGDFSISSNNYSSTDRVVLSQSYSDGDVRGVTKVGGILGSSMASVNICYSKGDITASTTKVGGIVGELSGGMMTNNRIANSYSLAQLSVGEEGHAGGIVGDAGFGSTITKCYYAANPEDCNYGGIVGYSGGYTTVSNCLTTLASLGYNLGEHKARNDQPDADGNEIPDDYYDWNGDLVVDWRDLYYFYNDNVVDNDFLVTSILDNIATINGENAYSTNIWPIETYPWYCVKFASFQADTDAPEFDDETIN